MVAVLLEGRWEDRRVSWVTFTKKKKKLDKTNKQANKTRNIEIKNNLTVIRGYNGGGEGFSGLKDTWTKPRESRTEGGRLSWLWWWVSGQG